MTEYNEAMTIHENLRTVSLGDTLECRVVNGSPVVGVCISTQQDQAGIRVTLCPVDASRVPHRICQPRTIRTWLRPHVERWDEATERWQRDCDIVDCEVNE